VSLLDIDEVRAVVSTDLSNLDLWGVITREEIELVRRFGAHTGAHTETHSGGGKSVYCTRPIASVTSVSEYLYLGDTTPQALVVNTDYVVWETQGRIERIAGCFGPKVVVAFTPDDDQELRKQVLIELIRIGINQSTFTQESVSGVEDSYSSTMSMDWQATREQQYARLMLGPL
jgi:hypothetical protein